MDLPWASRQVRRPRAGVGGLAGIEGTAWARRSSVGTVGLVAGTVFTRIRVDLRMDLPWASRQVRRPMVGAGGSAGTGGMAWARKRGSAGTAGLVTGTPCWAKKGSAGTDWARPRAGITARVRAWTAGTGGVSSGTGSGAAAGGSAGTGAARGNPITISMIKAFFSPRFLLISSRRAFENSFLPTYSMKKRTCSIFSANVTLLTKESSSTRTFFAIEHRGQKSATKIMTVPITKNCFLKEVVNETISK